MQAGAFFSACAAFGSAAESVLVASFANTTVANIPANAVAIAVPRTDDFIKTPCKKCSE
jgi:hypothetical protein